METARFLVKRHPNVYMDLSGIPPQRIPEWFPEQEKLADKTLWGTDWPGPGVPDMGATVQSFLDQKWDANSVRRIVRENAINVFGL